MEEDVQYSACALACLACTQGLQQVSDLLHPHTVCALQQEQYAQQPGFFDKAMAYVPSLHSSGHSHPTEELPATHMQTAPHMATGHDTLHGEAQPSLLDKAKAYIPVLGSSTEFDPATEARMGEQDRLYRDTPTGQAGLSPDQVPRESLFDKAKAYVPAMGAPGTTAGIDVSTCWAAC